MKIVVGIKHVPDTEAKIKIGGDGKTIDEAGIKWDISPYDEYALEQALQIRDARGGEVIVVCAGREASQITLRKGLAMGADRAMLVSDERFEGAGALTRAKALAAIVRAEAADLVLLGKYGVGTDEWLTGPMLGEILQWPHATAVVTLDLQDAAFTAHREVEGGTEVVEGSLPAVLTCEKGLNEPRYASLKGIMQAKKKQIETKTAADLGLEAGDLDTPAVVWDSLELPAAREAGVTIEGSPQEVAEELVRRLREEAKVI